MIDLGSTFSPQLDVFDVNGNAVNAATITLTITQPDGSQVTPSVQNPPTVTGQYSAQFVTVMEGRHTYRWVTTGPNVGYTDVFNVQEAVNLSIFSLSDAKQQLGMPLTYTTDDAELRAKLYGITKAMENYKREKIIAATITEELRIGGFWWRSWPTPFGGQFRLTTVPVLQLQALQTSDGKTSWDVNNMDVDKDTGICQWIAGPPVQGRVTAMYQAGYRIIPHNYIEAGKVLLQHVWESRRGPGGLGGVIGPEELADYRHFTSMPRKAMEWLGPPRPVVM